MFSNKYVKYILILCVIFLIAGLCYSFDSGKEKHIDKDGYGWISWWDANADDTCQAEATVAKSESWLPSVIINEYAICRASGTDANGNLNQGNFYMFTLRRGATVTRYKGADSDERTKTKRIWFACPNEIRVHAKAQVLPRIDSDTDKVETEF